MNKFGENIRIFREQMNWSQTKFADKLIERMQAYGKELNYTNRSISMWETGERLPSLEVIMAVSDLTGCSIEDLLKTEIDHFRVEEKKIAETSPPTSEIGNKDVIELSNSKETYFVDVDGVIVPYSNALARELFEILREWRLDESVIIGLPPYCVFDDKTLNNIVDAVPYKINLLWLVSGMKSVKIDQYGQRIVELVNLFLSVHGFKKVLLGSMAIQVNDRIESALGILGLKDYFSRRLSKTKRMNQNHLDFEINAQCIRKDSITLTDFTSGLGCRTAKQERQLRGAIMSWLLKEGFVDIYTSKGGKESKVASNKGESVGLITDKRVNGAGYTYYIVLYHEKAQRMIVENLEKIKELHNEKPKSKKSELLPNSEKEIVSTDSFAVDSTVAADKNNDLFNKGEKWSDDENEQLKSEYLGGESVTNLATIHGRTRGAIIARLTKLGFAENRDKISEFYN